MRIFILILIFLMWGCSNSSVSLSEGIPVLEISIPDAKEYANTPPISHINLNKPNNSIPGTILKAKICGDTLWVIDHKRAPGVYAFDMEGNNVLTISPIGNGPGEMISFYDFDIENNNIYILDLVLQRVNVYDCHTGEFVKTIKTGPYPLGIAASEAGIWYDRGNCSYYNGDILDAKLIYMDSVGKSSQLLKIPEELRDLSVYPRGAMVKVGDSISYYPSMQPVILSLSPTSIKPKYTFDFGKKWPTKKYFERLKDKEMIEKIKKIIDDEYVFNLCYLENEKWLHLNFDVGQPFYLYFHNKHTGESCLIRDSARRLYYPIELKGDSLYISSKTDGIIDIYDIPSLIKQAVIN